MKFNFSYLNSNCLFLSKLKLYKTLYPANSFKSKVISVNLQEMKQKNLSIGTDIKNSFKG